MSRADGRQNNDLRPIEVDTQIQTNPEGSLLYRCGGTLVLISASINESIPDWMRDSGKGWVTAEYAMHPRANPKRQRRDSRKGHIDGRSSEIQRLIARSLRAAVRLDLLGPRSITVDCDVLDADGGTRTASVTGGCIALMMALDGLRKQGQVPAGVLREPISAISVGLVGATPMIDLCYTEDSVAEVDLNVVGTEGGKLIEVQGTAEDAPVPREQFTQMLDMALASFPQIMTAQRAACEKLGIDVAALMS